MAKNPGSGATGFIEGNLSQIDDRPIRANYTVTIAATTSPVECMNYQMAKTPSTLFFPMVVDESIAKTKVYSQAVVSTTYPVECMNYLQAKTPAIMAKLIQPDDRPIRADIIGVSLRATTAPIWPAAPPIIAPVPTPAPLFSNPDSTMPDRLW